MKSDLFRWLVIQYESDRLRGFRLVFYFTDLYTSILSTSSNADVWRVTFWRTFLKPKITTIQKSPFGAVHQNSSDVVWVFTTKIYKKQVRKTEEQNRSIPYDRCNLVVHSSRSIHYERYHQRLSFQLLLRDNRAEYSKQWCFAIFFAGQPLSQWLSMPSSLHPSQDSVRVQALDRCLWSTSPREMTWEMLPLSVSSRVILFSMTLYVLHSVSSS